MLEQRLCFTCEFSDVFSPREDKIAKTEPAPATVPPDSVAPTTPVEAPATAPAQTKPEQPKNVPAPKKYL